MPTPHEGRISSARSFLSDASLLPNTAPAGRLGMTFPLETGRVTAPSRRRSRSDASFRQASRDRSVRHVSRWLWRQEVTRAWISRAVREIHATGPTRWSVCSGPRARSHQPELPESGRVRMPRALSLSRLRRRLLSSSVPSAKPVANVHAPDEGCPAAEPEHSERRRTSKRSRPSATRGSQGPLRAAGFSLSRLLSWLIMRAITKSHWRCREPYVWPRTSSAKHRTRKNKQHGFYRNERLDPPRHRHRILASTPLVHTEYVGPPARYRYDGPLVQRTVL